MGNPKPPAPVIVQPPAPTVTQLPQPDVADQSRKLYESQLEFGPKLSELQLALSKQYLPQYQQLAQQQYPQLGILSNQTTQALQSPYSLNPQQQSAQDAIRQRQRDELSRSIREQANVGGTLYGGRAADRETRAQAELSNQYALSDIGLQQQQRQQTLQELLSLAQIAGFPAQQIQTPTTQGVTPSPDALLAAMQGSTFVQPAAIGFPQSQPGFFSGAGGSIGSTVAIKLITKCLPGTTLIDTLSGQKQIVDIEAGEEVGEFMVLFKHEYFAYPTTFVRLEFADGTWVETCDTHRIDGKEAQWYLEGNELQGKQIVKKVVTIRDEKTYDLLTTAPDGGYPSNGIHVQSMIPVMHRMAQELEDAHSR